MPELPRGVSARRALLGLVRSSAHVVLVGLVLLVLVAAPDAQRRGRGRGGRAAAGGGGAGGTGADAPAGPVFLPGFNRIVKVPTSPGKKQKKGDADKKDAAAPTVDPKKEAD